MDLELARLARGTPQPAGRRAGAPGRARAGPAAGRAPHAERRLQPPGGDAQVVHGLGVGRTAHPRGGREQGGAATQQVLARSADREARRGTRGRREGALPAGRHHTAGAGRPWASSAATRSHSSSEMSSTLRVASIVVNAYSCESASSSWIMRRW